MECLRSLDDGSPNDALRVNVDTPDKSVLREESLDFMRARVDTPVDNELGNGDDIKLWIDVPRELTAGGSFVIGTTWYLDDTRDDIKSVSGAVWTGSDTDGNVTVFETTGIDGTVVASSDLCRGNCRAVKAMVLSIGGVTPCGNNIDTKRLDGDDSDPDLLTGSARLSER